jgi:hypothetical protein
MLRRERALWALVCVACVALLCAPALWNGFPLLQYDTGGYLARWYEGYLVPSRAVVYGLILNAGSFWNFWPVVVLQSALTVWVIALVLRVHDLARPLILLGVVVLLTFFTTLPWLSAIMLTDIFCGLGVLGLYLLIAHGDALKRAERIGLIVLVAVAAATHSATIAVLIGLFACALIWRFIDRTRLSWKPLRDGASALILGAAMVFAANYAVSGRIAWTPGGIALSFGRMLQDGIVARYLDDHCPDKTLRLCSHRHELPHDADEWFWGNDVFIALGRFDGLGVEMSRIAVGSLLEYPGMQLRTAIAATANQIVDVHSGEGVNNEIYHTYAMIEMYTPWMAPAMRRARQQVSEIDFDAINHVHYPLALIALGLLLVIVTRRGPKPVRELAAAMLLAVLMNAAICGVLSNPHDRYGARIVWLAGFAVAIAALRLVTERAGAKQVATNIAPLR